MTTYKCISCGATKESEGRCSCPVCGYMMFETPYDKKNVLISEIESYISHLMVTTVKKDDLIFIGKDKDDSRFPTFKQIRKYVSSQDKTESFLSNLLETVKQLNLHFSSQFSNTYPVSFDNIDKTIEKHDENLLGVAQTLTPEQKISLCPVEWKKVSLLYTETPNKYLWFSANELIELIEKLANKIIKFIKINNLYGNSHKYYPKSQSEKYSKVADFKDEFEEAVATTEAILNKKYIVDILDDGTDELQEMLTCLWYDIELIMSAPLFIKNYDYLTESVSINEEDLLMQIANNLTERYKELSVTVNPSILFQNKSEDDIFERYKELIRLDEFGFLVPNGTRLINIGESEKKLNELIGLSGIKESIKKIKAYAVSNRENGRLNINMCFLGNPGTGKTEVARFIAGILYENKILPTKKVVEVDRSGLVSQYFGATAEKTAGVIHEAMGGVLFIDEAYALGNNSDTGLTDYGKEAIDTLVKAMEDYRGKICVIFAGYKNEMLQMLSTNPGLESRIQFMLDFPNYSRDELQSIAQLMLSQRKYSVGESAMSRILDITDIKRKNANFANAREIRNILDQVIMCQNLRCNIEDDREIGLVDVNKYIQDTKINLPISDENISSKILTGEEELDRLVGLDSVKRMVKKIKAYAKRNKDTSDFNLHMCFYGNPGTGKTEVARILSRILYDAGVLDEAKLVETDGQGLIGKFVGETAPKTEAKINDAMNGVLFIDEAYSLVGTTGTTNYGNEAIAVLLKEMEDRRGQFCVILAGYKEEMSNMLNSNPGFESRIQFTLNFPDYSREELEKIAKVFLLKKNYDIEPVAMSRLMDIVEHYRNLPNFANARTVRNILDQVLMNQNLRTEDFEDNCMIILSDVEEYLLDEGIDLSCINRGKRTIGFI